MGGGARRRLGKRLIPVQGAAVPEAEVPKRPRRLNYIFFREGQSFARSLRELAAALRQDVEWIREHTRLSEAAARWQARDRGTGGQDAYRVACMIRRQVAAPS
jgi:hypothetical protein